MTPPLADRSVMGLLIAVALGLGLGRIIGSEYLYEPSVHRPEGSDIPRPKWASPKPEGQPTFSSNDRSRWATIRALVDEGTFVIGRRQKYDDPTTDSGIVFEAGFQTVDKILHPQRLEFYSTKPPLLTVLAAGQCWLLKKTLGWRVAEDRWLVVRSVLITFNLLPFALYLWLLGDLAIRLRAGPWATFFVVLAGAFGGMVWPFLVTFTNHIPATVATLLVLWCVTRIALEDNAPRWLFALAGLSAGFAFACELPALSLLALAGLYLGLRQPFATLSLYLPLALLAPLAQTLLDFIQLGQWTPTYALFGTQWYTYPGSHWLPEGQTKPGIDYARRNGETRAMYALHLLIGHHGWFSLMPVWLLSVLGMGVAVVQLRSSQRERSVWAQLTIAALLLSGVVIGFYLFKSDNYGGWTNGPRWLMWLSPLWLVALLPVVQWLSERRWGVVLACSLLAGSLMAMNYQAWNPWRHPWIYNWLEWQGWPGY